MVDLAVASVILAVMGIYTVALPLQALLVIPLTALLLLHPGRVGYLFSRSSPSPTATSGTRPLLRAGDDVFPVIYPVALHDKLAWVLKLNPRRHHRELSAAVTGTLDLPGLAIALVMTLFTLRALGLAVFRRTERRFADIA
ncbi:MAG: hypothetical protein R3B49_02945 [Phycisphaerales bacterium]